MKDLRCPQFKEGHACSTRTSMAHEFEKSNFCGLMVANEDRENWNTIREVYNGGLEMPSIQERSCFFH